MIYYAVKFTALVGKSRRNAPRGIKKRRDAEASRRLA